MSKSKRILSWVLSCALMLSCLSGLTLFVSAEDTTAIFDATRVGDKFVGEKDGFQVLQFTKDAGYVYWNESVIANAVGLTTDTKIDELTVEFDYYLTGDGWFALNTIVKNGDGNLGDTETTNSFNSGWADSALQFEPMVNDQWAKVTFKLADRYLGGAHDLGFKIGDGNANYFIRGIKVAAKVKEETHTAIWGTYAAIKLDYTSGAEKGDAQNLVVKEQRGNNDNVAAPGNDSLSIKEYAEGKKALEVQSNQNNDPGWNGACVKFATTVAPASNDLVMVVEYYTAAETSPNTRMYLNFGLKKDVVDAEGNPVLDDKGNVKTEDINRVYNFNGTALVKGQPGLLTYKLTAEEAAQVKAGKDVKIGLLHDGNNPDSFYLLSTMILPADAVKSIANPGYEYFDFTKTFVANAYYPTYTAPNAYGMGYSFNGAEGKGTISDAGLAMEDGALYFTVTDAKADGNTAKPVAVILTFAEGTTGKFNMNYQSTENDWTAKNDVEIDENGQVKLMLDDAKFTNGANGGSMRLYIAGKTLTKVEVIVKADKTALNEAINAEVDFTGKTTNSIAAYKAAVEAAKKVADNELATQKEVDAATAAINAAKDALKDIIVINGEGETSVNYKDFVFMTNGVKDEGSNIGWTGNGAYVDYEIDVKTAGWYKATMNFATLNGNASVSLRDGNNNEYGSFKVEATGWQDYKDYEVDLLLRDGAQIFRIYFVGDGSNYKDFKFEKIEDKPVDKTALEEAVNAAKDNLDIYIKETADKYAAALEAAKAVLADEEADQFAVNDALNALKAAEKGLKEPNKNYAEIDFTSGAPTTFNSSMGYNHPDDDDGEDGNGIYKITDAEDALYGIKLSQQGRGFGYNVNNDKGWLEDGDMLRITVTYFIPEGVAQDNTRIWVDFDGSNNIWRYPDVVMTGEVATLTYDLTAEQSAKFLTGSRADIKFFNCDDDAKAKGDYAYIMKVMLTVIPDTTALQAAVDAEIDLSNYTKDTVKAYNEALEAAKKVLADSTSLQGHVDDALAALNEAKEGLVELPSMLVAYSEGALTTHDEVEALAFGDRWAFFKFMDRLDIEPGDYDLDVKFYYASTATTWWQIQLSSAEEDCVGGDDGGRYGGALLNNGNFEQKGQDENGEPIYMLDKDGEKIPAHEYSLNDGFGQTNPPAWMTNSGDAWTTGTVSFKNAHLPTDASNWPNKPDSQGKDFDFGFHICYPDSEAIFIRGVEFTVTDKEGNTHTAMWGTKPTFDTAALTEEIAAAPEDMTVYTAETAEAYTKALEAAKAALKDATTQDEIDAALAKLVAAKAALVKDGADLIIESLVPSTTKIGETATVLITIKNVGNKDIPADTQYGAAVTVTIGDKSFVIWTDAWKTTPYDKVLKAGESLTLPATSGGENGSDGTFVVPDGEFTLSAKINDQGEIAESDLTNNDKVVTYKGSNVDFAKLQAAVNAAKALDAAKYTEDSMKAVTDELAKAEAVLAKEDATQDEINAATAALEAAVKALVEKEPVTPPADGEELLLGDVNFDGVVDSKDAALVLRASVMKVTLTDKQKAVANADGDEKGDVNSSDASLILKAAVHKVDLGKITYKEA